MSSHSGSGSIPTEQSETTDAFLSPEGVQPVSGCDKSATDFSFQHTGPFWSVSMIAREVGPGARVRGRKRTECRLQMVKLCSRCLFLARFDVRGSSVMSFPQEEEKC